MSAEQYRDLITRIATKKGIPPEFLYNQVMKESRGNAKIMGDSNHSYGLLQVNDKTATGILKMKPADLPKLLDPEFNLEKGTDYILIVRNTLSRYLPTDKTQGWLMTFMAYNSGPGYMLKALQKLKSRGVTNPTFEQAVEEMKNPGFGRTPMFGITVDYAKSIVGGATAAAKAVGQTLAKPVINIPLLLGLGAIAYFLFMRKKSGANNYRLV